MADDVQRIKDGLDIETVISDYVELKQAGQYLKGKSPFTDERNPSFYVSPEKGLYHCFSSGKGGDVFTFIQEMEGVEFREALEILADRAGITLEGGQGDSGRKKRLRAIVKEAQAFYRNQLSESQAAQDYLDQRGITSQTAETFSLGYAPDDWRQLLSFLQDSGFTTEDIISAGLVKQSDNSSSPYDRFRNRLMFPICDTSGRPIAFSGRRLDPDDPAKYINSPETPLFRKKEAMFGYHLAKSAMRDLDAAILVEGQTDLVLVHQAGYENVVASSGTSVTKQHLKLIKRFTENLILALDTDTAGQAASLKTARLALSEGMTPKVADLPDEADPADVVVESGAEELQSVINASEHVIPTAVGWVSEASSSRRDFLEKLQEKVLPLVTSIDNAITRDHFISEIARGSDLREKTIRSEIEKTATSPTPETAQPANQLESTDRLTRKERQNKIEQRLKAIHEWQKDTEEPAIDPDTLRDRMEEIQDMKVRDEVADPEESDVFAAELSFAESEPDEIKVSVQELLLHYEEVVLQRTYEAAQAQIARSDDREQKQELLRKCQEISQRIQDVRGKVQDHS